MIDNRLSKIQKSQSCHRARRRLLPTGREPARQAILTSLPCLLHPEIPIVPVAAPEDNVVAQMQQTALTEVHHVSQRKYNIDSRSPWWKRFFFRFVYLPFNRFAFTRLGIPAVDEVEIDGKKLTFCWYEDEGVFEDADAAEAACLGEFWRVKRMDFNRVYPPETAQRNGHRYPRANKPDRYLKPTFDLSVTNRREQEAIRSEIARLHKILDQ